MFKKILIPSLFLFPAMAKAGPFMSLDRLSLRLAEFKSNRDPQTPQLPVDAYRNRAGLDFDLTFGKVFFWENYVHMETLKTGTVKTCGWHWMLGMRLYPGIDLYHEHHSQHILDEKSQVPRMTTNKFPVEDSFGIRFNIVIDEGKKRSLIE